MDQRLRGLDWSMVETFLAVAETGTLSAAARKLGLTQPTVGRHVRDLEETLGLTLFTRQPRGMALAPEGEALLPPARAMAEAAGRLAVLAAGAGDALSGTVRITASTFVSHHVLPPIFARIREAEPGIALELVPTDASENLLFHAADIAVRMYRPDQLDIVTRHVADAAIGLFGATRYLDRAGRPATLDDLRSHAFVGQDRGTEIIDGFRQHGWSVDRDAFAVRCDSYTVNWELVRAGCGLGFAQSAIARRDPLVEELPVPLRIPKLPVWLAAHEALRRTPRIRRVWDMLADDLATLVS